MIYSRSAEYAIRALVHLASAGNGQFVMARQIAEAERIPAHFLAKILQQLARRGLLKSSKGPSGGFSLKTSPETITLFQLAVAIDGDGEYTRCLCGNGTCTESSLCGMHDSWTALRSAIIGYLEETSIADVAASLEQKRLSLEKRRKPRRIPAKRGQSATREKR